MFISLNNILDLLELLNLIDIKLSFFECEILKQKYQQYNYIDVFISNVLIICISKKS